MQQHFTLDYTGIVGQPKAPHHTSGAKPAGQHLVSRFVSWYFWELDSFPKTNAKFQTCGCMPELAKICNPSNCKPKFYRGESWRTPHFWDVQASYSVIVIQHSSLNDNLSLNDFFWEPQFDHPCYMLTVKQQDNFLLVFTFWWLNASQ